jgi:hypothetical protein
MSFDDDSFYSPIDGMVKTQVNSPWGRTWIIVTYESRLSDVETVLQEKTNEYLEKTGKQDATVQDLLTDPDIGPDVFKLYHWRSELQAELATLPEDEKEKWHEQEKNEYLKFIDRSRKVMERIIGEAQQGKRLILYGEDGLTSLTKKSPLQEMKLAYEFCSDEMEPEQRKILETWMQKAKDKTINDLKEEPIRLKNLEGDGFIVLNKSTHPDFLLAATRYRFAEMGKAQEITVAQWTVDSPEAQNDHESRIRIFHNGLDDFEHTTEIDLRKYGLNFTELLYKNLSSVNTKASLLDEHKQRLDFHYEHLLKEYKDPSRPIPLGIEIPLGISGDTVTITPKSDYKLMDELHWKFRGCISDEDNAKLSDWKLNAPNNHIPETIRVYSKDFSSWRDLHRHKDSVEIQKEMKSDENYMSWQDHEIAREWIDSLRPLSPDKLDKRAAVMLHSTGLRLEVDLNLVQKQPEKTIEILNDSHWTTTEENRNIIESWLDKQERKSQDELVVNGGKYDRQDPLSRLKQLADSLVDEQFQQLTPEEAKKLLIWIHTKEKYGDDYYKDPIAPQPQPRLSAVPSNDLKKQQRAMTEIIAELEQSVVQEKQKKKDKEEPFPSI